MKFVQRVWNDWGSYVLPDQSVDMSIILNAITRVFHEKPEPKFSDSELNEIVVALRSILQVRIDGGSYGLVSVSREKRLLPRGGSH